MILVNRFLFILLWVVCLGTTSIVATAIYTVNHLKGELSEVMKARLIEQKPEVITSDITVKFLNQDSIDRMPRTFAKYNFDLLPDARVLGRTIVPTQVYNDRGSLLDDRQFVVYVTAKAYYLRALNHLKQGDVVTAADIERVPLDIYGKPFNAKFDLEKVVGMEMASFVSKGTILTEYMVKPQPVVRRDDMVDAYYQSRGVELDFRVRVLDDGAVDDIVRVESSIGKKTILRGKVINEKTVYISR